MQAVLDLVTPDSAQALKSAQLDLPSATEVLYPDFSMPALHSIPVDDSEPAPAPPFSVDSMPKADWCVGSILAAQSRLDARSDFASRLHAQVDSWLDKASSADLESIIFLMASLRPFAEAEIAKQRRSRSLLLPSGTISLRRSPDQLSIDDPDAAITVLQAKGINVIGSIELFCRAN